MTDVSLDARYIGQVIAEAINGPNWPSIIAIIGTALVSWIGAFFIARMVAGWEKNTIASSTISALHAEIDTIYVLLQHLADHGSPYRDVIVERFRRHDKICPVYLSSASGLGHLSKNVVDDIVNFYSNIIMMRDAGESTYRDKEVLVINRAGLSSLIKLADTTLSEIEKVYPLKRRPRPKSYAEGID